MSNAIQYKLITVEEAHRAFANEVYRDTYPSEIKREEERGRNICAEEGNLYGVYINHTITSETEMTVISH